MSNYFPCHIKMHNIDFPSSEHAYQWRFLRYIDTIDLADEVLKAPQGLAQHQKVSYEGNITYQS